VLLRAVAVHDDRFQASMIGGAHVNNDIFCACGRFASSPGTGNPVSAIKSLTGQPEEAQAQGAVLMHAVKFLVAAALCLTATMAQAAGVRAINVPADVHGPRLHGAMWYPCAEPAGDIDLGSIVLPGVKDCPLSGGNLPLVVISHGAAGSFIDFHDLAETLADAGFVVAAINHPGNTSSDMSRIGDLSSLSARSEDIKRLIDFMVGGSGASPEIDAKRIGFFGFSRGGYTGLLLLGGVPDWPRARALCEQSSLHACAQIRDQNLSMASPVRDPRIGAVVVADPGFRIATLVFSFTPDSLAAIGVPVQLWASEHAGDGLSPDDVAAIDKNLPSRHEHRLVANAGHFAFMLCPPGLGESHPGLCSDPPGFDRAAFHKQFNADVLAFFRANLGGT
jgi:predicted dienelactone hydrolase